MAVATIVVAATGCGSATQEPAASPNPAAAASSTPRTGPVEPKVGVPYPFDLYTHCGIRSAQFGGRQWQAAAPRPEPARRPGADGTTQYTGYTAGTMTLLADGTLRFVITDPLAVGDGTSVVFMPLPAATKPPPPCA